MKVVDLFAGCGGLSLGFLQAGFDIVAGFDNWEPAINVYKKNFQHDVISADLNSEMSHQEIAKYKPDMIIGGPPCQDFSSAGKRDETLGRADLTLAFAEIISKTKPKYFLMENVDRITKSKILNKVIKVFRELGYGVSFQILDSSFCGVPQIRKRFIMFGELGGEDHALERYFDINKNKDRMTIRQYLGSSLGVEHYYRHPRNYNRRAIFSIDEPSPTVRGVNRPVPKGYKGHPKDSTAISKELRPLTTVERAWIQTFPKSFVWEGSKSDLEQMIGNAVPVKLAEFVAKCIYQYLNEKVKILI